jgi:glycosyltransferase involved in cell wall biosynthesis
MKVAVLIPTRNDRPGFLDNCLRMIEAQTLQPFHIEVMDYAPESEKCDITQRYRRGYEKLKGFDYDVIAFMEDDDFYSPEYLEVMVSEWQKRDRPDIFGTAYTIYYHLKLGAHFTMYHQDRASAMNTLIKPDLEITWPVDHEPFTDMHLWTNIHGVCIDPGKIISVGMKHGIGKCGGGSHVDRLRRYTNKDDGFLKNTLDEESYKFYSQFYDKSFAPEP